MRVYHNASAQRPAGPGAHPDFRSPVDRLAEHGILLRTSREGRHRVPCPECKKGKGDTALAVWIDAEGECWHCWRCEWRGSTAEQRPWQPRPRPSRPPAPTPERDPRALAMWGAGRSIWGTPAELYLRRRGLVSPDVCPWDSYPWEHLRCLEDERGPALIAAINDPRRLLVAVHRIALTPDGRKAPIAKPKLSFGPIRGNACRLGDPDDTVALTEGVEDGLAYQMITGVPTWAACGAGMVKSILLPASVREVLVVADLDRPGLEAAGEALAAFRGQGREARVVVALGVKDPAELLEREVTP